jgi:Uma2 family endonuclease
MARAHALPLEKRPRYIEAGLPLVFPVEEQVPETELHLELRVLLYQLLKDYLNTSATVGSDQFIYFNAADPKQVLAPDVYVCTRPQPDLIQAWKVWERGTPEVAVEVVSSSDSRDSAWSAKLARYNALGVQELVRFNPEGTLDNCLQIWDRVEGRLLQRQSPIGVVQPSLVLGLYWVLAPAEQHSLALRIATSEAIESLVPTRIERAALEAQARQLEAQARLAAEQERNAALDRVRELEALLSKMTASKVTDKSDE